MKQKHYYIFSLALALLFTTSCKDYLDVKPDDGIYNESFWKNRNDLQNAVSGCYSSLARSVRRIFVMSEIRSDLIDNGTSNDGKMSRIKLGLITSDNDYVKWNNFYITINLCNAVIKNAPKVLDNDKYASPEEVKSLTAEAYYIRALTYYYLVRFYKDVPFMLMPSENDKMDYNIPKTSEAEILNYLIKDLEENKDFVPREYSNKTLYQLGTNASTDDLRSAYANIGRVTRAAYHMLLADMYLSVKQYKKSLDMCDSVINSNKYSLIRDWYKNFYASDNNYNEHIFTILFFNDGDPGISSSTEVSWRNDIRKFITTSSTSFSNMVPSSSAYAIFSDPADIRGDGASIVTLSNTIWKWAGATNDVNGLFIRETSGANADPHWIVYRLADAFLMKAEALTEMGDYAGANDIVNIIRTRAGVTPFIDTPQDLVSAEIRLLEERALEFAYEGKRWFDLVRFGKRNSEMQQYLIEKQIASASFGSAELVRAACLDSMGWYYPIHKDELFKNLSLVQNPFYTR